MKPDKTWKPKLSRVLYRDHGATIPYYVAVVEELLRDLPTRREMKDGTAIFDHLEEMVANALATYALPEFLAETKSGDPGVLEVLRTTRGEMRAIRAWLQARPTWVDALRKHLPLLDGAPARGYAVGPRILVQIATDDERAPDLDGAPPRHGSEELPRETRMPARWQDEVVEDLAEAGQEWLFPWLVAVAESLMGYPEVRARDRHVSVVAADVFLVSQLAVVTFAQPNREATGRTTGLKAKDGMRDLAPFLDLFRAEPFRLDVMERHAAVLLPDSAERDALPCLRAAVEGTEPQTYSSREPWDSLPWREAMRAEGEMPVPMHEYLEAVFDEVSRDPRGREEKIDAEEGIAVLLKTISVAYLGAKESKVPRSGSKLTKDQTHLMEAIGECARFFDSHAWWFDVMRKHAGLLPASHWRTGLAWFVQRHDEFG